MILAGGYATRLRPLSYALPKLLFPVCGRPLLEQTIDHLSSFGIDEIVLAVGYLADQLKHHFGEEFRGVKIRYSLEDIPLGTGGPIALAREYFEGGGTFLVMNGDILSEMDIGAMLKLHESKSALVTIALHEVADPTRFGVVRLGEGSHIREFVEKPTLMEPPSRLVNAGVYLMRPQVIDRISAGRKVIIEREVFPALAVEGKLVGFIHTGAWFDIGNIADFVKANFSLLESRSKGGMIRAHSATVAESVELSCPAFIGDTTIVEDGVKLGPQAIIGSRVHIQKNATLRTSIVFDDARIGRDCTVDGAVIGNSVRVGDDVRIEQGSVIAGHVRILDHVRLTRDVYVHPYKEIDADVLTSGHVM